MNYFVSVRDLFSNEVAQVDFRGWQPKILRGKIPDDVVESISRMLQEGHTAGQVAACAFSWTAYSPKEFARKKSAAESIRLLCGLNKGTSGRPARNVGS
jgi:hypothetical protein